jgi:hypothetical protein
LGWNRRLVVRAHDAVIGDGHGPDLSSRGH